MIRKLPSKTTIELDQERKFTPKGRLIFTAKLKLQKESIQKVTKIEETKVDAISSRWIRCVLQEAKKKYFESFDLPTIDDLYVAVKSHESLSPDLQLSNKFVNSIRRILSIWDEAIY